MHLSYETSQKVEDQQSSQDTTGFESWYSVTLRVLTSLSEKMARIEKIAIFWYFTKIVISQVQNNLESLNLAKLCTIILFKK